MKLRYLIRFLSVSQKEDYPLWTQPNQMRTLKEGQAQK